jgi:hypothetical protein
MKQMAATLALLALGWVVAAAAEDAKPTPADPRPAAESRDRKTGTRTMDRLELESTAITGNRELPKVMYVVPWKRADLGDLGGKPLNSLIDEVLTPVDREVFGREISYFRALDSTPNVEAETPVTAVKPAP